MTSLRRYDLDWLKSLAVLLVPIMHGGIIFTHTPYLIENSVKSVAMDLPIVLMSVPIMPLFFAISGMSIYYALNSKSAREFVRSRILRLLVPFLFGLFTISSISTYYALRSRQAFSGSYFEFYPHYFDGWWGYGGNFPWYGHHLYFLIYLCVFSLVGLPLFLFLRAEINRRWIAALAAFANKPGGLYLLVLPAVAIEITDPLKELGLPHQGGWHIFSYVVFLLCGFLMASNDDFLRAIHRYARASLVVAGISVAAAAAVFLAFDDPMLAMAPVCIYSWSIDIAVLSAAHKRLNKPGKALALLSDSALPFYIVHEGILVPVAFYVCATSLGILPKFAIILVVSLPLMVLAAAFVRRVNVLRFLFGLPPIAQAS